MSIVDPVELYIKLDPQWRMPHRIAYAERQLRIARKKDRWFWRKVLERAAKTTETRTATVRGDKP